MVNLKESDEKKYLHKILSKLHLALESIEQTITNYSSEILKTKRYIHENSAQLDLAEKAANRIEVNDNVAFGKGAIINRAKLQKLINSPYFARIDFMDSENSIEQVLYIGVYAFSDLQDSNNIIYDWRAPISSMFYDFETGPAFYMAPDGRIEGILKLKRQYRIRQSQMEYMLESSLNIGDDILQKELSQNSDNKMKNIVATIQREQNAIIRNEDAKVLIIQGVAGSGKTSIALHRIAFLLYRYKQTLTSNNILIISPSKIFGSYISNVLPELGEKNILEMSFEDIATNILEKNYQYQTFSQQVENLLDASTDTIARIKYKASNNFVEQLQAYLEYAGDNYFVPIDLEIDVISVCKEDLLSSYHALKRLPINKRLNKMADNLIAKYNNGSDKNMDAKIAKKIRGSISKMFKFSNATLLYKDFFRHINKEDLFILMNKTFEYCDVYPFIYVKMHFDGIGQDYRAIQHLLVDEMQDYSPIQYAVLAKLFLCKMTILGDSNQIVNPYSSSTAENIQPYFKDCNYVELCKSYRSTIEIANFGQKIKQSKKLIPIERHGDRPNVIICNTVNEQYDKIEHLIKLFKQSSYTSLGVICKSQTKANQLYEKISPIYEDALLLNFNSSEYKEGVIITSIHMSKGLEFDQVIVTDASNDCYKTEMDRSLLYIACTRAMHKLDLTCIGNKTELISDSDK